MNNNEELINKDAKNTVELLSDDELSRVSGGDTEGNWPVGIEKVADVLYNHLYACDLGDFEFFYGFSLDTVVAYIQASIDPTFVI